MELDWNIVKTVYVTYCKFSTFGFNLFNYLAVKFVTYTVSLCLNRLRTIYMWLIKKGEIITVIKGKLKSKL